MSELGAQSSAPSDAQRRRARWLTGLTMLTAFAPLWGSCSIDPRAVSTPSDAPLGVGGASDVNAFGGSAVGGVSGSSSAGDSGAVQSNPDATDAADASPECLSNSDCAPSGSACLQRVCNLNRCEDEPVPPGAYCSEDGGIRCDGNGVCWRCSIDELKNDNETDIDCGGQDCPKCAPTQACQLGTDCDSGVCQQSACQAPTCSDGVRNGGEGGVDCGGPCGTLCVQGDTCGSAADCTTGYCSRGVCCGVACNGLCERCVAGTGACTLVAFGDNPDEVCGTSYCDGTGQCHSCGDLTLNGDETSTDCGGPLCRPCAVGSPCKEARDCASCVCTKAICEPPACSNRILDGCESDIDCGGPCGDICAAKQHCNDKSDCASHECVNGSCVGP